MPFGSEGPEEGIGVALSGGGFRATLFHVGALWRLVELGILPRVARVASVSGGSITAGVLATNWPALAARPDIPTYTRLVVEPLRAFCRQSIDSAAIGEGIFSPFASVGDVVERKYRKHLFGDATLADLPAAPRFIFNATNLQTGRSFRLSKPYMGDYRIGLLRNPTIPVARAVAASSAFPPVLSPIVLDRPGTFEAVEGADLAGNPAYTKRIFLSDGGVYDNLGLETVWNRCRTVLVSDAGAPFSVGDEVETDWIKQSMRALDVATDQSRGLRKRALVDDLRRGERQGAYWGIDTRIADYGLADAMACRDALALPLATIRTRLNPFSDREQEELVNWGYALADASIRRFAPALVAGQPPPAAWPYPRHALDRGG